MSQKSVPIADVGTPTGWSTPVWSKTDELKPGDPDYTASSSDPAGDTFVVQLGAFGVPPPTARPFRVNVRARATAGGTLLVTLLQGSTVVASRVLSPGTTFDDNPFDLTVAEIGRIDYSAGTTTFRIEGKAYGPTVPGCSAPFPPYTCATYPRYMRATISAPSCSVLNGRSAISEVSLYNELYYIWRFDNLFPSPWHGYPTPYVSNNVTPCYSSNEGGIDYNGHPRGTALCF